MRLLISLLFLLLFAPSLWACDVCGSGAGDNVFGLLPNYRSRFMGLRYRFQKYYTEHPPYLLEAGEGLEAWDYLQRAEIWGRYGLLKNRVQLFATLPYQHYSNYENEVWSYNQGLGDASVQANITLYNNTDSAEYKLRHFLQLGFGLKLPTGSYQRQNESGELLPANLQMGTGSWDVPLMLLYNWQYRSWGGGLEMSYTLNTRAPETNYAFGDRWNTNLYGFYRQKIKGNSISYQAGLRYEYRNPDYRGNIPEEFTYGWALWGRLGADLFLKNYAFGLEAQLPIQQALGEGYVYGRWQASLRAIYLF